MRLGKGGQCRAQSCAGKRRQRRLDEKHIGGCDDELGARQPRQLGKDGAVAAHNGARLVQYLIVERAVAAELGERTQMETQRFQAPSLSQITSIRFGSRRTSALALTCADPKLTVPSTLK